MKLALLIAAALAAYGAGGWLGVWLNRRLKLTPWPGAHWHSQLMIYLIRGFIFFTALMVPFPVVLLLTVLLG
jgi:hypothetical protein